MDTQERRFLAQETAKVRLESRDEGPERIVGYAAMFYDGTPATEFRMFDDLVERIAPTAFDKALADHDDVVVTSNHNPDNLLGRTAAGTARLVKDKRGLRYEANPPDTTAGHDVVTSLRRGDLRGSSFVFNPRPGGARFEYDGETVVRMLTDVVVAEVGPVTHPAYEATSAEMRSLDQIRDAVKAWCIEQAETPIRDTAERKLRLSDIDS